MNNVLENVLCSNSNRTKDQLKKLSVNEAELEPWW